MANAPDAPKGPEAPFDVRKLMSEFDPSKLTGEFQNMLKQYKLPGVDTDALVASPSILLGLAIRYPRLKIIQM